MEFVISKKLKKVLEASSKKSVVARDLLKIKTVEECNTWINFLCIAEDDPSKISYLNEGRYNDNIKNQLKPELKVGDKVVYKDENGVAGYCNFQKNESYEIMDITYNSLKLKDNSGSTWWFYLTSVNHWDFKSEDKTWDSSFRYMTSCGKVVGKIFGHKKYNGNDLATFCEIFAASHPNNNLLLEHDLKFVKGDEIKKWYHEDSYNSDSGTLGNSCMRYSNCQSYFDIYTKNTEQVQLCILINKETSKLLARCIVWENKYFDRVYGEDTKLEAVLVKHLENIGLIDIYNNSFEEELVIKLEYGENDIYLFPYLDTLSNLNGNLLNNCGDGIELKDTNGGQNTVWSDYHDENISEDEAVYSEELSTYIYDHCAIRDIWDDWIPEEDSVELINGSYLYETLLNLYLCMMEIMRLIDILILV